MTLRFDGKVAVVTGAGGGLGRAYALLLASRGAKVLVNDLGVTSKGEGFSGKAADKVVDEIRRAGGIGAANYDSVENGDSIIESAIRAFGRVDILINNAGILRDISFAKMTTKDWDILMKVHVYGSFACARAAWPYMLKQNYGRIINVSSGSGLYGNFGQVNYSTAKLGLVGFTKALAAEGQRKNVLVNVIAPIAMTRMTEGILPKEIIDSFSPETVAPVVTYLAHDSCGDSGEVYELGGGWVAKLRWQRTEGHFFGGTFTPEDVKQKLEKISDYSKVTYPTSLAESIQHVASMFESPDGEDSGVANDVAQATADLKSGPIISFMMKHVSQPGEGQKLVDKVKAVYQFDILAKKGAKPISFVIDLKTSGGKIYIGKVEKFDAQFTMLDEDFVQLVTGKLNPQMAFLKGKMKIKGNMGAATKFTPDLFPKYSKA